MDNLEFSFLPPEIQLNILRNTDPVALIHLCQTSSVYASICSSEYEHLWKVLVFEMIQPLYNYRDIEEFNKSNRTYFNNWYEVYKHYYELGVDSSIDIINRYLFMASFSGNLEEVKYLIYIGADIHAEDDRPLRSAVSLGFIHIVRYLVSQGADIHRNNDIILEIAASNGHLDIVKYLVSRGANVDEIGIQALMGAVMGGHLDIVKYLINIGVNIHAHNNEALKLAYKYGHLHIVKYLQQ